VARCGVTCSAGRWRRPAAMRSAAPVRLVRRRRKFATTGQEFAAYAAECHHAGRRAFPAPPSTGRRCNAAVESRVLRNGISYGSVWQRVTWFTMLRSTRRERRPCPPAASIMKCHAKTHQRCPPRTKSHPFHRGSRPGRFESPVRQTKIVVPL